MTFLGFLFNRLNFFFFPWLNLFFWGLRALNRRSFEGCGSIVLSVITNGFCDLGFKFSERILSNFFPGEVLSHDSLDKIGYIFISIGKIFIEFICDHFSELLALLDDLCFFYGGVQLPTLFVGIRFDFWMLAVVHEGVTIINAIKPIEGQ